MDHQPAHRPNRQLFYLLLVIALLAFPSPVRAFEKTEIPPLETFIAQVMNGNADELRGIYVSGVFADVITPQPVDDPTFVTSQSNALTQFGMASRHGSIGLLAHNYLAGSDFFLLEEGQLIYLIYGDGRTETYIIRRFLRFQALTPQSTTSDFVDLETGELLSASNLFHKVFQRKGDVVLQTCIYADGNASWGRLFIIAEPYEEHAPISMPIHLEFQ